MDLAWNSKNKLLDSNADVLHECMGNYSLSINEITDGKLYKDIFCKSNDVPHLHFYAFG